MLPTSSELITEDIERTPTMNELAFVLEVINGILTSKNKLH